MKKPIWYQVFAWSKDMDKKRKKEFQKFYKKHSFDPTETWNLDQTIAEFILPRLNYFRKNLNGHPGQLKFKAWKKILKKMSIAFEHILKDDMDKTRNQKKIDEGLLLFVKYYGHLWDWK